MIVKDGWFGKQRFLKPDVSEDISSNRSSLSKPPSLSIVFSILNIAKHYMSDLLHLICYPQLRYLQTLNNIAAENNSTVVFPVPMDLFSKLAQAVPGLPDTSGLYIYNLQYLHLYIIYTIVCSRHPGPELIISWQI